MKEVIIKEVRESIDILGFVNARNREREKQEQLMKKRAVLARKKKIKEIKILKLKILISLIVLISVVGTIKVGRHIESLPRTIDTPCGYHKEFDIIDIKYGSTLDEELSHILDEKGGWKWYRLQDLKYEVLKINDRISNPDCIQEGMRIAVPYFVKD